MIDFENLKQFRKRQPLYSDYIRKMAMDELQWLLHPADGEVQPPNPKQIERFHRVLLDNGIIKRNAVCSSWESDLKMLAN